MMIYPISPSLQEQDSFRGGRESSAEPDVYRRLGPSAADVEMDMLVAAPLTTPTLRMLRHENLLSRRVLHLDLSFPNRLFLEAHMYGNSSARV